MTDYRKLLSKYIELVVLNEGTNFIHTVGYIENSFLAPEEVKLLEEVAEEAYREIWEDE